MEFLNKLSKQITQNNKVPSEILNLQASMNNFIEIAVLKYKAAD